MKKLLKNHKRKIVCLILAVMMLSTAAFAAGTTISKNVTIFYRDIKLCVDKKTVTPTNAKGDVVEPFIMDGTTYVPLRAIASILGKDVDWDGNTSTVYIGQKPVKGTTNVLAHEELKVYDNGVESYSGFGTGKNTTFQNFGEDITAFNFLHFNNYHYNNYYFSNYTYKLDSKYASIKGTFLAYSNYLGGSDPATIKFYNIDNYGEETLIAEYSALHGDAPVEIEVDLTSVNMLRIRTGYGFNSGNIAEPAFYNVTLDKYC